MSRSKRKKSAEPVESAEDGAPVCPDCGGANELLGIINTTEYQGCLSTGERYTATIRKRFQCGVCGRVSIGYEYQFEQSKWKD